MDVGMWSQISVVMLILCGIFMVALMIRVVRTDRELLRALNANVQLVYELDRARDMIRYLQQRRLSDGRL